MCCINMKVLWSEGKYYEMFFRFMIKCTHTLKQKQSHAPTHIHICMCAKFRWTLAICIHSGAACVHLKWNEMNIWKCNEYLMKYFSYINSLLTLTHTHTYMHAHIEVLIHLYA